MSSKKDFDRASFGYRKGFAFGKIMGKVITNLERGFDFFEKVGLGFVNDALKTGADAVSAHIQKLATKTTKPFALSVADGFAEEKAAALKNPASLAQERRRSSLSSGMKFRPG